MTRTDPINTLLASMTSELLTLDASCFDDERPLSPADRLTVLDSALFSLAAVRKLAEKTDDPDLAFAASVPEQLVGLRLDGALSGLPADLVTATVHRAEGVLSLARGALAADADCDIGSAVDAALSLLAVLAEVMAHVPVARALDVAA